MRLGIDQTCDSWISVVEITAQADIKRYKTLFLRELYAVYRVLPFDTVKARVVDFGPSFFLVMSVPVYARDNLTAG